jgi:hypothetical protein
MKNSSLRDKLKDKEYLESLCDRRLREIIFCSKILNEEELSQETSIQVGYQKARKKFIDEYLDQINPELAQRAREKKKIPIFNMLEILEELE